MKVKILSIIDHGHNDERIILNVVEDTDIGKYFILDSTYTSTNKISNKVRHPYWFPDKKVKTGDLVILYTKKGEQSETKNADGTISHFFHWGLDSYIWNNTGDCALLFQIDDWMSHKVSVQKK